MNEINVFNRQQHIIVDPNIASVDLLDIQYESSEPIIFLGSNLYISYPATVNTGNKVSGDGEISIWNFLLPDTMKVGDQARLRVCGSVGDLITGGSATSWYFRVYLNNVKVTELQPTFTPHAGYGSTPQRCAFRQEIDLSYQASNSAWVWHRHGQSFMSPYSEAAVSTAGSEGDFMSLAAYAHPTVNLANIPIKIAVQNAGAVSSNVSLRGLTVEHLVAP